MPGKAERRGIAHSKYTGLQQKPSPVQKRRNIYYARAPIPCHSCNHHHHYHRPSRRNLASNAGIVTYTHIEQLATDGLVAASPTDTTAFCFQDRGIELHHQHQQQAAYATHRLAAWGKHTRNNWRRLSSVSPDTQHHTKSGRIASNPLISLDAYAHS